MIGGNARAARARALVGTRFRPQGRSAETGLDCIGLAAAAVGAIVVRTDYPLRGGSIDELRAGLSAAGLEEVSECEPGDILITEPGPAQLHLAVCTGAGIVHADSGLRRIVERPGPIPWPVVGIWRVREDI